MLILTLTLALGIIILFLLARLIIFWFKYNQNKKTADRQWESFIPEKIENPGSVGKLTVLPLVDWYCRDELLSGEAGVSWLIQADEQKILMDAGLNLKKENPSPLLRNSNILGVDLKSINHLIISHLHPDHIGGLAPQKDRTVSFTNNGFDISHMTIYAPVQMQHQSAKVRIIEKPEVLMPGIASEGPIARSLFGMSLAQEQALVVNVAGKGLVLIVGCGHQGIRRIFERAESIFNEPIYGLIAGLHYPVTQSRLKLFGLPLQKFIGTGKLPWRNVTREDVNSSIEFLKTKNLKLISISAHDSCDWTIDAFRNAFKDTYRYLEVGVPIEI